MPASEEEKPTARQQLPNQYRNNGSDCRPPVHPLLWSPPSCTPFQKAAPSPGAQGTGEAVSQHPPVPAASQAFSGKPGTGRVSTELSFGEGLPVPSHSCPQTQRRRETQGDDPSHTQLPPRSQRTSQRGRVRKKKEEAQVPGWLYLLPSSVFL